jgi:hypothetical protein
MFLPVYLAMDFGAWSFLVFAIPNVIGAAAVPFLLTSTDAVHTFTIRHHSAVRAFAWATILFHIVFLTGFMPSGSLPLDLGVGAVALVTALIVGLAPRPRATIIAVGVWALSIGLAIAANLTAPAGETFSLPPTTGAFGPATLAMAAPAIVMGFLLCPILDGTFLATREFHGRATPRIFVLAFSLLFPVLILLTLGYAGRLIRHDSMSWFTYAHLAVQSGFTVGVQVWALRWIRQVRAEAGSPVHAPALLWSGRLLLAIAGAAFGAAMFAQAFGITPNRTMTPQRFGYDLMLSMYGLVFPAYLLAIAVPGALGRRGSVWALLAVLVVAGSLYWHGAIGREYWAIPVAVAVVLLAPALARRLPENHREIA